MARRKSPGTTTHTGTVLPPPPDIPKPRKTDAEVAVERKQKAEMLRLLQEISDGLTQQDLDRAVVLAQMAARHRGPLIDFFKELGRTYRKLADEGSPEPEWRVIRVA